MDPVVIGLVICVVLVVALASGLWIALGMCVPAFVGLTLFTRVPVGEVMANSIWGWASLWSLAPMPLFVWMGEILFRSGLSESMFRGLAPWVARLPGGLLHINIASCALFAAACGSSAVTTATIGKMSLPELRKQGYPDSKSIGTLCGSGTIGFMIPPSVPLIVYGAIAELSIARLFIAGVIPGIIQALAYMIFLVFWAMTHSSQLPPRPERVSWQERFANSRNLIPMVILILSVLGSIYGGIATPTEAGAVGVLGALLVSYMTGTLSWKSITDSILGATRTSCMIGFIVSCAGFVSIMMAYTKIPATAAKMIAGMHLSQYALIAILAVFYMVLGCFLESVSMIVLTAGVVMPMVQAAGIDPIWFGIFIVFTAEMAVLTPPVGMNLYVIQGLTGKDIIAISRATIPFFFLLFGVLVLVVIFPGLATWLPNQMILMQ
jgi:tripartite ATP-independent transporter DctM subunit